MPPKEWKKKAIDPFAYVKVMQLRYELLTALFQAQQEMKDTENAR